MHICLLWPRKRRRCGTNKQQEQHAFAPGGRLTLNEEHVEDPGRMGRGPWYNHQVGAGVRFWMWKRLRSEAPTNNRGNARLHREESGEGLQRDLLDCSQIPFLFRNSHRQAGSEEGRVRQGGINFFLCFDSDSANVLGV